MSSTKPKQSTSHYRSNIALRLSFVVTSTIMRIVSLENGYSPPMRSNTSKGSALSVPRLGKQITLRRKGPHPQQCIQLIGYICIILIRQAGSVEGTISAGVINSRGNAFHSPIQDDHPIHLATRSISHAALPRSPPSPATTQ